MADRLPPAETRDHEEIHHDPSTSYVCHDCTASRIGLGLAQVPVPPESPFRVIEYSAKFLCGEAREGASVRPGTYETSINIHNPHLIETACFGKKAVLAPRQGDTQQKPRFGDRSELEPDYAEGVDCKIIRGRLFDPPNNDPFIEGFVVLLSVPNRWPIEARELDVVAVYTVDTPPRSISLEIKTIAPRIMSFPSQIGHALSDRMLRRLKPESRPGSSSICWPGG